MAASPGLLERTKSVRRIMASHTSPEEAATVFARAKPRLAVYTHVSVVTDPSGAAAMIGSIIPRTRASYGGPVELGDDLMTVTIGDQIEIRRFVARNAPR